MKKQSHKTITCNAIVQVLKTHTSAKNIAGMARFGINSEHALGIPMPFLRHYAKTIGNNHILAQELWDTQIHEARILASLIDNPQEITQKQMDKWAAAFDSWDICDQVCMNLFWKTPYAYKKAQTWTQDPREFVKRAGFALIAVLAWKDKATDDTRFIGFFPFITKESIDERNFVRKAVNWALRQIGKRNVSCMKQAVKIAKNLQVAQNKNARWIGSDALREFQKKMVT